MQHRHPVAEARNELFRDCRRQRNFRHQQQRRPPLLQATLNRVRVHLGLATAGHAVQQHGGKAASGLQPLDLFQGTFLFLRQHQRTVGHPIAFEHAGRRCLAAPLPPFDLARNLQPTVAPQPRQHSLSLLHVPRQPTHRARLAVFQQMQDLVLSFLALAAFASEFEVSQALTSERSQAGPLAQRELIVQRKHGADHFARRCRVILTHPVAQRQQRRRQHRFNIQQRLHLFQRPSNPRYVQQRRHHAHQFPGAEWNRHPAPRAHLSIESGGNFVREGFVQRKGNRYVAVGRSHGGSQAERNVRIFSKSCRISRSTVGECGRSK